MPFLDLTPHEIGTAVLDKGLLGLVALGFGYWLNRRMEMFRSRRATEAEFLRERTKRLDELFGLMLDAEIAAQNYIGRATRFFEDNQRRRAQGLEVPDVLPPEVDSALMEFHKLIIKTHTRAAACRPWIGDVLASLCAEYDKVVSASVREQTFPRDLEKIKDLKWRTADLQEKIAAAIREGSPAPTLRPA